MAKPITEPKPGPWRLTGIDMRTRELALESASRTQMTISDWVTRAIERQAGLDERTEILRPGAEQLPVLYEPTIPVEVTPYIELLQALSVVNKDAAADLARELVLTARSQLKKARGTKAR